MNKDEMRENGTKLEHGLCRDCLHNGIDAHVWPCSMCEWVKHSLSDRWEPRLD